MGKTALIIGAAIVGLFVVGMFALILTPNRALDPLRPRFTGGEGIVGGLLGGIVTDFV